LVRDFQAAPQEIQEYFEHFPKLAEDFPWEVALSYMFGRVELAHNMAIYCGAVKLHRTERTVTRIAVQGRHMTRDGFKKLFHTIHGEDVPAEIAKKLEDAEAVRDKVMHGKAATQEEQRRAITDVLQDAKELNDFIDEQSGFRPFNNLRGFKGRAKALDKETTRWVLKGMGFSL